VLPIKDVETRDHNKPVKFFYLLHLENGLKQTTNIIILKTGTKLSMDDIISGPSCSYEPH
jgi:hypothetical protein